MVENSDADHGRGLRYPKMWQTRWWEKIVEDEGNVKLEMDMCQFNKKPEEDAEGNKFYKKRTAIVTRRSAEAKEKLGRTCPGVNENHQHIREMGKAAKIDRSTESGVYSKDFAKAVCEAALSIHRTLRGASNIAETTPSEEGGVGVYCGCVSRNKVRKEEGLPNNLLGKGSPKIEDRAIEDLSAINGDPNAAASGALLISDGKEAKNTEEESGKSKKEKEVQHRVKNERSAYTNEWRER